MVWRKTGKNDEILTGGKDGNNPNSREFCNKHKKNTE
jgi:hypothetical protein